MEFDATFLISIISFIIFVFIMNAIFYKPVMRIMEERNKVVEDNFNKAEEINKETEKQELYHSKELDLSRNDARMTIDKQIKTLESEKTKIVAAYKKQLFLEANHKKENLKQSAIEAKEILKDNVVDIAKNISNILLGSSISNESIDKSQIHIKEEQV